MKDMTVTSLSAAAIGWRAVYVDVETRELETLPVAAWGLVRISGDGEERSVPHGLVAGPNMSALTEAWNVCWDHVGLFVGYAGPALDTHTFRDGADDVVAEFMEDEGCDDDTCQAHAGMPKAALPKPAAPVDQTPGAPIKREPTPTEIELFELEDALLAKAKDGVAAGQVWDDTLIGIRLN